MGSMKYNMLQPKRKEAHIVHIYSPFHYRRAHPKFLSFRRGEMMPGCTSSQDLNPGPAASLQLTITPCRIYALLQQVRLTAPEGPRARLV